MNAENKPQNLARMAKTPLKIPEGVKVEIGNGKIAVTGKLGRLEQEFNVRVMIVQEDGVLIFSVCDDTKLSKAISGTIYALIKNMFIGVTSGFEKKLILHGVGYRVNSISDDNISLSLGYSHPVVYNVKALGVKLSANGEEIVVKGLDKCLVGQVAAELKDFRKPDPYKGKGIRSFEESKSFALKAIKKH